MIRSGEIQKKATSAGVRDPQVEKDYILSWILKGISQHKELSELWVFKGVQFTVNITIINDSATNLTN